MNCNKYYKHEHLMTSNQKGIYSYFKNLNCPKCPKCDRNKDVIAIIHSCLSRSMKKVAYLTGDIGINLATNDKRSNWHCKRCQNNF
jgi:hypothetical protein